MWTWRQRNRAGSQGRSHADLDLHGTGSSSPPIEALRGCRRGKWVDKEMQAGILLANKNRIDEK
jgi:hypothetical protein